MAPGKILTLVVATTSRLGIGNNGGLPWPSLKGEMGYFARVTRHNPSARSTEEVANAVVMGRKTWDSIPSRFRPLKGRINVVISNTLKIDDGQMGLAASSNMDIVRVYRTVDEAVHVLQADESVGRIYMIGGSSIYRAALQHAAVQQVLLTKIIHPDYECDTFFPADIEGDDQWRRATTDELSQYTGEDFSKEGPMRTEGDISYEFCLFTKKGNVK